MQTGTGDARHKGMKRNDQLRGHDVKVQGHTNAEVRFGGLADASFSTPSVE